MRPAHFGDLPGLILLRVPVLPGGLFLEAHGGSLVFFDRGFYILGVYRLLRTDEYISRYGCFCRTALGFAQVSSFTVSCVEVK